MAPSTRGNTRARILDAAEHLIMRDGFAGTSIDAVIGRVGVTKGAFFYHFKSKAEMARALVVRNQASDAATLERFLAKSSSLSSDPVQRLLVFTALCVEMAEQTEDPTPGCLFGSFCYESGQFDEDVLAILDEAVLLWRREVSRLISDAIAAEPPVRAVDVESLADMVTVVYEGAFVVARTLGERGVFAAQLRHLRTYFELLWGR
jgi:TetR/AcrR family transcriptional repressor of nem operon